MSSFALDRIRLIFFSLALVVVSWAVLDTRRFLRLLSDNRKTTFTRAEIMAIRVPGAIVILGAAWAILATLFGP
ncbi:MAG TPA: hypothetical protein VFW98_17670 [Gemmatimonadaceae bacterium]|nr:hypothetical protein [Gemmatimonadaceae bacterium]